MRPPNALSVPLAAWSAGVLRESAAHPSRLLEARARLLPEAVRTAPSALVYVPGPGLWS